MQYLTLDDFTRQFYGIGDMPPTIYVFEDQENFDFFMEGDTVNTYVLFTLHSHYAAVRYLKDKYLKAPVRNFCAVDKDKMACWIDLEATDDEAEVPAS